VECERKSTIIIGFLLIVLALSAMATAAHRLWNKEFPDTAVPGMVIAALSLSFMFFLWHYKLKAAKILNSKTLESDA
jgi:divalent metal cation (Fe/Co/Zn/Cd) transporter